MSTPVKAWLERLDPVSLRGTESNPRAWEPLSGVVVAYDAGNTVLRARRMVGDELEPMRRASRVAVLGR